MTEEDKLAFAQPITDIYTDMETDLMDAIAKRLAAGGEISPSAEWRLMKLAESGALTREAAEIIAGYTGIQSDAIDAAINAAAVKVIGELEPAFSKMAMDGFVSSAPEIPISEEAKEVVSLYRRQAASDLNLVNTVMRFKAGEAYRRLVGRIYNEANRQETLGILGKHTLSAVSGAESRQQAVRNCIREFSRNGIPAFVDKAGREWSPEAYVNMNIRTTISNTAHAAQDEVCDRHGVDLIEVSSHMGARPKCAPYQGRIFSRGGKSGVAYDADGRAIPYSPLSETSFGQPDGLFGINCRHKKYPFVSGAGFQAYFPYDEAENAERYKALQQQRYLERRVREASREADLLKISGDEEGAKAARLKARNRKAEYKKFCSENGFKERNDRGAVRRAENGLTGEKMASNNSCDWNGAVPQAHSREVLDEICAYAKERDIKIYLPQKFDGDIEMLRKQIDTVSEIKAEYNIKEKITFAFKNMLDDDFAETINSTISFNNKAMRNAEITNRNLNADNVLAATDYTGIAAHEMGHIISRKYGEKGLDFACKAYYNIYGKTISNSDMLSFLNDNVSEYSVDTVPDEKHPKFKEITPELISKSRSTNHNQFSREFIRLLKESVVK